jgi:HlyD family secretion protein
MQESSVFRKVALDRLASPEQLDQLLPVTDPRGWVALAAVGVVLLGGLVWAVLGRIPVNVGGTGILVKSGGVLEVIAVNAGQITDVAVGVGDAVTEGQAVARVAQPELSGILAQAKANLADLRAQHEQLVSFGSKDVKLQSDQLHQQRTAIVQAIVSTRREARWTRHKLRIQEQLVDDGLMLRQTLLDTREKEHATVNKIAQAKSQLAQIAVKELELRNLREQEMTASKMRMDQADRNVQELIRQLQAKSQIVSPYTGRILEILVEQGVVVAPGEPILRLDLSGRAVKGLEAVIFVPSRRGKQIQVGMPVRIAPTTVKQEEYGMLLGTVTSVSDFPSTVRGMQRVLKNEKLVESLSGADVPYEIHADLMVDPGTVSQYRWSSSKGPPEKIRSGTLAVAQIEVAHRRPIELVLPIFKGRSSR